MANAWDLGPYGTEIKRNIENIRWTYFVQEREDMIGLDSQILMNPKVWEASGHVGGFSDPLIDCKKCKSRERADKLIEEYLHKTKETELPAHWAGEKTPAEDMMNFIHGKKIKCPKCGTCDWTDPKKFNLMFKTQQGVIEGE